ncbi:trypsin-like serine protease [Salmonella sp. s54925]|uniref:trypsin-like serine protease n=1 Tax=Salmonella sp. s54925 TaxID=3159674 RepID=UPI003980012A
MRANQRKTYWFPFETRITHQMLCGGDDSTGASTCLGDSGGPYVCRNSKGYWVLQGITSWGSKRCLVSERYSVFSKVRVFTSWIENVMNGTTVEQRETGSNTIQWTNILKKLYSMMQWLD